MRKHGLQQVSPIVLLILRMCNFSDAIALDALSCVSKGRNVTMQLLKEYYQYKKCSQFLSETNKITFAYPSR